MNECIVCKDETDNEVVLKSGLKVYICTGEDGCLIT